MMEAATTETRPQPQEHTLVHFEIPAKDPEKVAKFYTQLFGWKFQKWQAPTDYWLISLKDAKENDTIGGLYPRENPKEQYRNYFMVRSVDETLKNATSLGAKVVSGKQEIPNVGIMAILEDPDGNVFALFQPTGRM